MKKIYQTLAILLFVFCSLTAQTPQAFKYQAIARDNLGNIISDQNVSIRISILQDSVSGTPVYIETHTAHTNHFGLVNIAIGNGTGIGDFSSIDWGNNLFFIKTEMDPAGGNAYALMGTSQLLSVPYSLFSENTANVDDADADPLNEIQTLSKSGSDIVLSKGGLSVTDEVDDADNNPANELQSLSILGSQLSLSPGGGSVNIATELPVGSAGKTLYHNGSSWLASTNIFNNGGNIGIGTTSPGYPLHIYLNTGAGFSGPIYAANSSTSTNQQMWGIKGRVSSTNTNNPGAGVWGVGSGSTGNSAGVRGETSSATGIGVYGWATNYSGVNYGVYSITNSSNGYAGYFVGGENYFQGNVGMGTTDPSYPLHAVINTGSTGSRAIYGDNISTGTGQQLWGVYGKIHSTGSINQGAGVMGFCVATTGKGMGTRGETAAAEGKGVFGWATHNSGVNYGVFARTSSPNGYAGYFEGGENYFEGNVGIGTDNPYYPLHISTDSQTRGLFISNTYSGTSSKYGLYTTISADGTGTRYGHYNYVYANTTDGSPSYGGYFYVNSNNSTGNTYGIRAAVSSGGTGNRYAVYGYAYDGWAGYFPTGDTYVGGDLRVGSTMGATGYKVSVNGKIMCEELRVELSGSWPDYVFNNEYQLMSLEELEKSIKKNKHLPGLPSANSIEENGIMVGDITQTLTQKVEELTLYIIELNNYTKELNEKVEKLEKENKGLKDK